ncbi:hypothetical protein GF406_21320 [candidate division KSB1 bacterium]|nr:hypothetical protein [candidate division KSB1 bacterium]
MTGDIKATLLRPLYSDDNPSYQRIPPHADPKGSMRCGNCHTDDVMISWGTMPMPDRL